MNGVGSRLLVFLAFVAAGVGVADAAISREWDLLAIFVLIAALLVAVWIRQRVHRVDVTLRPDLAHWIEHRAESGGESYDDVLDRAVATFKHGIVTDERTG